MSISVNLFWWRLLVVITIGVALFGLGFIVLQDVMQGLFNWMFFSTSRLNESFSPEAAGYLKFTFGVLGAVMVGWMVVILRLLLGGFRRGEREAWDTIALSMVIWYGVDTAFSLAMGYPANAIFNTLVLIGFAIPLGATYRQFHA